MTMNETNNQNPARKQGAWKMPFLDLWLVLGSKLTADDAEIAELKEMALQLIADKTAMRKASAVRSKNVLNLLERNANLKKRLSRWE
jgi:hypothetical protein